jgi:predicted CoA-substrate-specific enzyme activase
MITAGVDIGSSTSKAVLVSGDTILGYSIIFTGSESIQSANQVLNDALHKSNLSAREIHYIIATGYGRVIVPFAHESLTELTCHARGANWLFPGVRTILDMGGQDCKAIRCDQAGRLQNFIMNDKCAAGTGRFLELMSRLLGLSLDDLGTLSFGAKTAIEINSTCAVFAKSEVTSLIRKGKEKPDVIAGLHKAIASRVTSLLKGVGIEPEVAVTGGIGKNKGVVHEIEKRLGLKVRVPEEPQVVGALGAALLAQDKAMEIKEKEKW